MYLLQMMIQYHFCCVANKEWNSTKGRIECPYKYVGYGLTTSSYGSTFLDQSCRDMFGCSYAECLGILTPNSWS